MAVKEAELSSNLKNWTVLFSTMLVIGAVVLTILEKNGTDEATAVLTLRLTAYSSFLIYLFLFVARPLRQLVYSQLTQSMKKNRRYFGIALAGSHTVHLVLIIIFVFGTGVPLQTLCHRRSRVYIPVSHVDHILRRAGCGNRTGCVAPPAQGRTLLDRRYLRLYAHRSPHTQP